MASERVAVVGGGIFGVTAALRLAQAGYATELFEKEPDLLRGASAINQYRLHRGYHYPRSLSTLLSCKDSEPRFCREYPETIIEGNAHYYAIAKRRSLTAPEVFLDTLRGAGLEYQEAWLPGLRSDAVSLCVQVKEKLYDADLLRAVCWNRIKKYKVRVHLNRVAHDGALRAFDHVIVATYSLLNQLLAQHTAWQRDYQYEVCEKPVLRLPPALRDHSVVIMDGPFTCIDPKGYSDLSVMGHVVHAIHASNVGRFPLVPPALALLLNRGIIPHPPVTHLDKFLDAAQEFFNGFHGVEHVGSMFTVRTVLPGMDATDERPTLVEALGDRHILLFSGKVSTCVDAADEVLRLVRRGH